MLSEPNPLGKRDADFEQANESWMGFSRIFDNVWSGKRHAMLGPTQIDRFGHRLDPHREQAVEVNRAERIVRADVDFLLQQYRPGVEAIVGPEDR